MNGLNEGSLDDFDPAGVLCNSDLMFFVTFNYFGGVILGGGWGIAHICALGSYMTACRSQDSPTVCVQRD